MQMSTYRKTTSDEVCQIVRKIQYVDWRHVHMVDFLSHPPIAEQVGGLDLTQMRQMPDLFAERFGNYDQARSVVTQLGRMSRVIKKPVAVIERGFDSLDAVREMMASWVAAFDKVASVAGHPGQNTGAD
jgi:hypothetical protein